MRLKRRRRSTILIRKSIITLNIKIKVMMILKSMINLVILIKKMSFIKEIKVKKGKVIQLLKMLQASKFLDHLLILQVKKQPLLKNQRLKV